LGGEERGEGGVGERGVWTCKNYEDTVKVSQNI